MTGDNNHSHKTSRSPGDGTGGELRARGRKMKDGLQKVDPEVAALIESESRRQHDKIRLIPSENYVSHAVREATGSVLSNKYSEGYATARYYEGQQIIDQVEQLCVQRARELFGAEHVNVQPYSGSPANQAVYTALAKPGDTVMGMSLAHGGHLTHGAAVSVSGLHYNSVQYGVDVESGEHDFDEIQALAARHRPRLLFCGATAYPRVIDFERFARIGHDVGAVVVADIAHISGLVAAGVHPSPVPHVDIVTTTTHKSLRGPRGGMIMCRQQYAEAIDRAVFPGLQGGPHNHTIAAIAVALREAQSAEFKQYARAIVDNARALGQSLLARGFRLASGGTDNHLLLVDVTNKGLSGQQMAKALDAAGIVCNKNLIPGDRGSAKRPSGIRIGTPAVTSRGFGAQEMERIAEWISDIADVRADGALDLKARKDAYRAVASQIKALGDQFPAPGLHYPE